MLHLVKIIILALITCASSVKAELTESQICLQEQVLTADKDSSIEELEKQCSEKAEPSLVDQRLALEKREQDNPFSLTAYRRNYILPLSYNTKPNNEPWQQLYPDAEMMNAEVKFQLSFKALFAKGILGADLWGAYTQKSWWQLYNSDSSAMFRETNYEPEIFLHWDPKWQVGPLENHSWEFGFNHQSNGRSQLLSRSWNRLYVRTSLEYGNLVVVPKLWHRLEEDADNDDNPDITDYLGYGDITLAYKWRQQVFSAKFGNTLNTKGNGYTQLEWTLPLGKKFKFYTQYYNGYGESLIDYNVHTNRFSVGFLMNDWL